MAPIPYSLLYFLGGDYRVTTIDPELDHDEKTEPGARLPSEPAASPLVPLTALQLRHLEEIAERHVFPSVDDRELAELVRVYRAVLAASELDALDDYDIGQALWAVMQSVQA